MTLLFKGSFGQDVRNLQTALNYHLPKLLPALIVDGRFGPKTFARLVQFQSANNLKPDGIVGPNTSSALYSFVSFSHQVLSVNHPTGKVTSRSNLVASPVASLPSPFEFPELPRLQFPFPIRLPPLPFILQPPRLELDPNLLLFARNTKFELEAGQQTTFKKDLNTGTTDREVALIADLKATVWSKPFGKKLELSAGGGMAVEQRVRPSPNTETSVYVFAKAEVHDILKIGPLDLAKLEAEAQISGNLGQKAPPDLTTTVTLGPEVEAFNGKVTFGPGAYLEYKTNGKDHSLTPGVKVTGTFHF